MSISSGTPTPQSISTSSSMTDDNSHDTIGNATNNTITKHNDILLSDEQHALPLYFTLDYQRTFVKKSGLLNHIKKTSVALDIDLNAFLYDDNGQLLEMVWYKNLRDASQSIRHHGDELLGKKKLITTDPASQMDAAQRADELESIELQLQQLPANIHHIALVANTFSHTPLNAVSQGSISLQDNRGRALQHIDLTSISHKAHVLWVATLYRQGFDWRLTLHDEHVNDDNSPLANIMAKLPKQYDTQALATLVGQQLF